MPTSGSQERSIIHTPSKMFHFLVEEKRSFLTKESVNELIARVERLRGPTKHVILLAPYIARPRRTRSSSKKSLLSTGRVILVWISALPIIGMNFHINRRRDFRCATRAHPGPYNYSSNTSRTRIPELAGSAARGRDRHKTRMGGVAKELQAEGVRIAPPDKLHHSTKRVLEPTEKDPGSHRELQPVTSSENQIRAISISEEKTPEVFPQAPRRGTGMRYALTGAPAAAPACVKRGQVLVLNARSRVRTRGPVPFHVFWKGDWQEAAKGGQTKPDGIGRCLTRQVVLRAGYENVGCTLKVSSFCNEDAVTMKNSILKLIASVGLGLSLGWVLAAQEPQARGCGQEGMEGSRRVQPFPGIPKGRSQRENRGAR